MDFESLLNKATCFLIWRLDEDCFFNITVEKTDYEKDLWAIVRSNRVWSKKEQQFIYVPLPSNRSDDFWEDTRFSLQDALEIAQKNSKFLRAG